MVSMRNQYEASFKANVALEAIKGEKIMAQLAGGFGVHPSQISRWKAELLEKLPDIFSDRRKRIDKEREETEPGFPSLAFLKIVEYYESNTASMAGRALISKRTETNAFRRRPAHIF